MTQHLTTRQQLKLLSGIILTVTGLTVVLLPGNGGDGDLANHLDQVVPNLARTDRYGDPLPPWALLRLGTTRLRNPDVVEALAFSQDGSTLASGCFDGTILVWDTATGKERAKLSEGSMITSLVFSPDGSLLAAGCKGGSVSLWQLGTAKRLRELSGENREANDPVWTLGFSGDGRLLVASGSTIRLWQVATGKILWRLPEEENWFLGAALSPDGQRVTGINQAGLLRVWAAATGNELSSEVVERAKGTDAAARLSPDGCTLATTKGSVISLWDIATKKELHRLLTREALHRLVFSPDGKSLAGGGRGGELRLWSVDTGKELFHDPRSLGSVSAVAVSSGGTILACADTTIRLWDVSKGQDKLPFPGHNDTVWGVAFSPNGDLLASAGSDDVVRLWEYPSGRALPVLRGHGSGVKCVSFSPDGRSLASASFDRTVCIWDVAAGRELRRLEGHADAVAAVAFSPDGRFLASASWDGTARLWQAATGKAIRTLTGGGDKGMVSASFSPDSKLLAVTVADNGVRVWDVTIDREVTRLRTQDAISSVSFSPDGKLLAGAVGSVKAAVHLWSVRTWKEIGLLESSGTGFTDVTFSPDGQLISCAGSSNASLWEVATGRQIWVFRGHQAGVSSVAFDPKSRALASGSHDTSVLVWDTIAPLAAEGARRGQSMPESREALWRDLADEERGVVAGAVLVTFPKEAIRLLQERVHPVPSAGVDRIDRLVADLDADDFATRRRALIDLAVLEEAAEPALHRALEDKPSAEARRSVLQLLNELELGQAGPSVLRRRRALRVLEQIGTAEAQKVLEAIAAGAPEATSTRDAKRALARLTACGPSNRKR